MPIIVSIPCRRFTVRAHLGYVDGLSLMEQYALRVLAARPSTAAELSTALGLDTRMALDLGVDLVRSGLAEIQSESGALRPSQLVLQSMGDPARPKEKWAAQFASERAPEVEEVPLVQDLIGGGVFSAPREDRPHGSPHIASESPTVPPLEQVDRTAMAAAAARAIEARRTRRGGRDAPDLDAALPAAGLQVVDVSLAAGGVQSVADVNASRSRLSFELEVRLDEEEQISDILVVGPLAVPRSVRRGIGRGLMAQFTQGGRQGDSEFFGVLKGRARAGRHDDALVEGHAMWNPSERVRSLGEAVKEAAILVDADASLVAVQHDRLLGLWQEACHEVSEAAACRSRVELVVGTASHQDLVLEALGTASNQVVLMCPWIGQLAGNAELRDALRRAVEVRGVQVHLIWGISSEETRGTWDPAVAEFVGRLEQAATPGALHCNTRGAAVHAKFIAKDHEWAVVSSCNFLNAPRQRTSFELGARFRPPDPTAQAASTSEGGPTRRRIAGTLPATLTWSRSVIPDFELRRAFVVEPILGGAAWLPPSVQLREPFPAPENALSLRFWPQFWATHVESASAALASLGSYAQPIFDLDHRHLLFDELATARSRLLVTSDKLGVGLLGQVPFEFAAAAARRGLAITVVYASDPVDPVHALRRDQLAALGVQFVKADIHAKVLVADGRVTLSSFNFLSFEGAGSGGRQRRELGLRVFDEAFADSVVAALNHPG